MTAPEECRGPKGVPVSVVHHPGHGEGESARPFIGIRAGLVSRGVEDRGCDPELVEPLAITGTARDENASQSPIGQHVLPTPLEPETTKPKIGGRKENISRRTIR